MGMAVAQRLASDSHEVTVYEADQQLGGLATWQDFGGFDWDRFYHVILPTDRHLLGFLSDIDLADQLEWRRTYTGFYVDNQLHSISSNLEFLRFPLLSLFAKARLAWTMIYCSRINNWRRLEKTPVDEFLIRVSGATTYEKLWKPLLLAKLGENYQRVSAVFIWSYVKRMFSARDKSASAEHLGHVKGGYKMVFQVLEDKIRRAGGDVCVSTHVKSVETGPEGKLRVVTGDAEREFDRVICTSPTPVLGKIVDPDLISMSGDGRDVEYLGVVCVVIVSRIPLVPYYVVNIADRTVPFTGMIGMSTVIDVANTGGRYITYLPKYVLSTDPELSRPDEEMKSEFLAGVAKMLPDFDFDQIDSVHVNRAIKVQPLQVLEYSKLVPEVATNHPGLYVLNTSQFVNATLNNNEVIGAVDRFYSDFGSEWAGEAA